MYFLGIDVGSVSINFVLLDKKQKIIDKQYFKTAGKPVDQIKKGLKRIGNKFGDLEIGGVGTTGSGRNLAGVIVGADTVKNEITAHAVAATSREPEVKTVLEIGGQDSKIIIIRDGVAVDFAMNTVCAAGTGSFLEQQAARLGIPIEKFGEYALKAEEAVRIAGRCSVFAESDMIHKQQLGHGYPEIIKGLCEALVRNYLNNIGRGKDIQSPVMFQGGVAANQGIKEAFSRALDCEILVPPYYDVMGAIGGALLALEKREKKDFIYSNFKGFEIVEDNFKTSSFFCDHCANGCEIINIFQNDDLIDRRGAKCPRWELESENRKLKVAGRLS